MHSLVFKIIFESFKSLHFLNFLNNILPVEKKFEKNFFHLFYSNFFNIISEKKVKIYFFQFFFQNIFLKN